MSPPGIHGLACKKLGIIANPIKVDSEIHLEDSDCPYICVCDDISKDSARFAYKPPMNNAYNYRKCIYDILNDLRITANDLSSSMVL